MLCNLVAIPLNQVLTGLADPRPKMAPSGSPINGYEWCVKAGTVLLLLSSTLFFVTAMVPVISVTNHVRSSSTIMPEEVKVIMGVTIALFFVFAFVGWVGIGGMMWTLRLNGMPKEALPAITSQCRKFMTFQLVGFEICNLFKWVIALVIMLSIMNTTPIWE